VAFGRVYAGNTDGRVYAFDAPTGRLAWAKQTGAYVYSSPAIADPPTLGPTVYVGSYDGRFYALNAYSGSVRWIFNAHAKISGSPTVLGRVVYFAALGSHQTYGLDAARGNLVFQRNTGSFDPVISDGSRVYLSGQTGLFGLVPRPAGSRPAQSHRARFPAASPPAGAPPVTAADRRALAAFCADPLVRALTGAPLC
jgi:outer membrane protein assembly factor BamB